MYFCRRIRKTSKPHTMFNKYTKYLIIIATLAFSCLFASCSANKGFVSTAKRSEIKQVQRFEPMAVMGVIEKSDKAAYSDSLSEIARGLFEDALEKDETLPVTGKIVIEDSIVNNKVQYEILMMMNYIDGRNRPKDIPIPPTIDSILESRGERFGLLAYCRGFVRTDDNYDREVGKRVAVSLLTLGTYNTMPYKYVTHGGIVIVDSQNDNIAFVNSESYNYHPLKAETYKKLMIGLVRIFRKQYS